MPDCIYILVPTGEVRRPKAGEWMCDGECKYPYFQQAPVDEDKEWPIVTLHKIEIPEGAYELTTQFRGCGQTPPAVHIAIPKVKRKVKKWVSFFTNSSGDLCVMGSGMTPWLFDTKEAALKGGNHNAVEIETEEEV